MIIIPELRITLKRDGEGFLVEWFIGLKEHGSIYVDTRDKALIEAYEIITKYNQYNESLSG